MIWIKLVKSRKLFSSLLPWVVFSPIGTHKKIRFLQFKCMTKSLDMTFNQLETIIHIIRQGIITTNRQIIHPNQSIYAKSIFTCFQKSFFLRIVVKSNILVRFQQNKSL